jgi:urease accessory protein
VNDLQTAGLLRLADSAFPSGAFSQSFGLESAIADGRVHDEATLADWLEAYLVDGWATLEGGALVLALRDGVAADELDAVVTAATHAPQVRAANVRMCAAILSAFEAMQLNGARLESYRAALAGGRASGVPSLAFALAYAALDVPWRAAFVACASATLTGLAAVGTRAIPLGQRATARVLWNARERIVRALAEAERIATADELCAQAIEQEIDALGHRLLDGRLFAS